MKITLIAQAALLACAAFAPVAVTAAQLAPGSEAGAQALRTRIDASPEVRKQFEAIRARVRPYVERHRTDPAWIVSRLQMYWQSRHTQVYVKNGLYDHAEGTAPVPTVRFTGGRDSATPYMVPRIEDVKPYMGENDRLYLQNRNAPGQPWEWVEQAKTGRIIESINMRIVELARDAAFLYWYEGDEAYARFAYDIFDTYMSGLYHRKPPIDLNRGHDQTLVGYQSYEVIHEDIVGLLTEAYDFMQSYAANRAGGKLAMFDDAFRQWAELIIDNGVPWNNWNLLEARFVLQIAAVLGDDARYADRRGRQYYLNAAVEGRGVRQWSLKRLLEWGYDERSAMWNESPSYSINVLGDYLEILELLERVFRIDLLPQMPVLQRAALAAPQYLMPNGRVVGFGDTRYEYLRTGAIERLHAYAVRRGQADLARQYDQLLSSLRALGGAPSTQHGSDKLHALLGHGAHAGAHAKPVPVADFQTPTYYAAGPSWLIQRNGYTGPDAAERALVVSQVGSTGNHAQANGIAMELFAHGVNIAPESGRGSGYLQNDYREYYSQFPAHNTVAVDGKSTYAAMKSNQPLAVQAVYPAPGSPATAAFPWATFSDVGFREPETDAEQRRVLGTVRLPDGSGYFVDIFRSRRRDGADRYHDYIYHNLAQSMRFVGADGQTLPTRPTAKLAFADNDLIGYDYWYDRQSLVSDKPLRARFDLQLPDRSVTMHAWLEGGARREFFSVKAPPSTSWPVGMLAGGLDKEPLPTLVVRQSGEAWTRPFGVVFEPVRAPAPAAVTDVEHVYPPSRGAHAVGLRVTTRERGRQTIMSTDQANGAYAHEGVRLTGRYGIAAERAGGLDYLFLGHGSEVAAQAYAIRARVPGVSAALWQDGGKWFYTASHAAQLRVPAALWPAQLQVSAGGAQRRISGRLEGAGRQRVRVFDMPAMAAGAIR